MIIRPFHAVLRLYVELEGIQPAIWRRLLVRSDETLHGLHEILQLAMGWHNSHVYLFDQGGTTYAEPDPDWTIDDDSREVVVHAVLRKPGDRIDYIYDMGDEWLHTIRLEDVVRDAPPTLALPCCEGGARACPPEDAGGVARFMTMLEALADPRHREHEQWREWIDQFDPERFSPATVNTLLLRYAHRKQSRAQNAARTSERSAFESWQRTRADVPSMVMLQRVVLMMDEVLRDEPLYTRDVRERAIDLLATRHSLHPDEFARSLKPGVWAAGAVHSALMTVPAMAGPLPPPDRLAHMFGVSDTAVISRSRRLRGSQ